jgi:hypothetical protein
MLGNGLLDARDDTDAFDDEAVELANTWHANDCVTDSPAGGICSRQ